MATTTVLLDDATTHLAASARTIEATLSAETVAAGSAITVTVTHTVGAAPSHLVPNIVSLILERDDGAGTGTDIRTIDLIAAGLTEGGSVMVTIDLTDTGAAGGAARCGVLELNLRVAKTDGGVGQNYDYESNGDTTSNSATGHAHTRTRGWCRGSTTATVTTSNVSFGGAEPDPYAYDDDIFHRITLGATPYFSRSLNHLVAAGSLNTSSASGTTVFQNQFVDVLDDRFAAAAATVPASASVTQADTRTGLSGGAPVWTVLTTVTDDSINVDPRLTVDIQLQSNNRTFGTPPTAFDAGQQRLSSDLGFLTARITNARDEGVNGLTGTMKMWDEGELTGSEGTPVNSASFTTSTQGGEVGWAAASGLLPLSWDEVLPGGNWVCLVDVTTADIDGATYIVDDDEVFSLLSIDPRIRVLTAGGPQTPAEGALFQPGMVLVVGLTAIDIDANELVTPDEAPNVIIARLNQATGQAQYLSSTNVWTNWSGAADEHALAETVGGSNVWVTTFSAAVTGDGTWGSRDIFLVGQAVIDGSPYHSMYQIPTIDVSRVR
jgi:hypothetical protein